MRRHARPLTVALLTPYGGGNLGDQAIQTAFITNLRRVSPEMRFVGLTEAPARTRRIHGIASFPLSGRVARRAAGGPRRVWRSPLLNEIADLVRAWRLLSHIDLVVAAGGGQLDDEWGGPWGHPYTLCRWAALTRLRGRKFAVASVGLCQLRSRLSRAFVRYALKRASYRSYRERGVPKALGGWEFTRDDQHVADVAFSVGVECCGRERSPTKPVRIGISPMAFGRKGTWPTHDEQVYTRYLATLAAFLVWLGGRGFEIVVFTSSHMDVDAVDDLMSLVGNLSPGGVVSLRVAATPRLCDLLSELRDCDAVVASRLHGVILSHRVGVPALAISFDRKVDAEMEEMGCAEFCLDIRSIDLATLVSRFKEFIGQKDRIVARVQDKVHAFQAPLERQFERLVSLAGGGGAA